MTIVCNGEPMELADTSSLHHLLASIGCDRPGVAVAIDDSVVPSARWKTTLLQNGNRVIVIQAAQGG